MAWNSTASLMPGGANLVPPVQREGGACLAEARSAKAGGCHPMKRMFVALAIVSATVLYSHLLHAQAPAACAPSAGLTFICGLQNPEDVVLVPGTRWLLTSGMAPGAGLTVVDTQAKAVRKLYAPGTANARADRTRFANCPGPLDAKQAVLHGLALRAAGGGYTVYATNHGGRESVEVFEL